LSLLFFFKSWNVIGEVPADPNSLERDRVVILGNHRGSKIIYYFITNFEKNTVNFTLNLNRCLGIWSSGSQQRKVLKTFQTRQKKWKEEDECENWDDFVLCLTNCWLWFWIAVLHYWKLHVLTGNFSTPDGNPNAFVFTSQLTESKIRVNGNIWTTNLWIEISEMNSFRKFYSAVGMEKSTDFWEVLHSLNDTPMNSIRMPLFISTYISSFVHFVHFICFWLQKIVFVVFRVMLLSLVPVRFVFSFDVLRFFKMVTSYQLFWNLKAFACEATPSLHRTIQNAVNQIINPLTNKVRIHFDWEFFNYQINSNSTTNQILFIILTTEFFF
jgi:hypothetical protein